MENFVATVEERRRFVRNLNFWKFDSQHQAEGEIFAKESQRGDFYKGFGGEKKNFQELIFENLIPNEEPKGRILQNYGEPKRRFFAKVWLEGRTNREKNSQELDSLNFDSLKLPEGEIFVEILEGKRFPGNWFTKILIPWSSRMWRFLRRIFSGRLKLWEHNFSLAPSAKRTTLNFGEATDPHSTLLQFADPNSTNWRSGEVLKKEKRQKLPRRKGRPPSE